MSTWLEPRARTAPSLSFPRLLGRFTLAGLFAGLLAAAWLLLVTEPTIRSALVVEEARQATGASRGHEELFSRTTQLVGGVLGTVLTGVVLAVVFATVYGTVRHRLPGRTDLARATLLAAIGFGIVGLLPAIIIPANPPGVGSPHTVSTRTAIYGAVLLCGVVITMLTAALVSLLRDRGVGTAPTALAATVLAVALAGLVMILMPDSPDPVPADFPASVVRNFRLASLGQLLVLWAGMGVAGGWLLDRSAQRAD
ncbi:MAG TPA: CbtA family protein [Geodermatophilus sp.]|nr:CbtA family protein [Geodermatophilus sp.]